MNRLKQAWLALCGKLEPEVREVVKEVTLLGTPEQVTLYEVIKSRDMMGYTIETTMARFLACEQAHAEYPGQVVRAKPYYRIGDVYLTGLQVEPVYVQPKPKVAKGKKRG
jgi:hypothetical protein